MIPVKAISALWNSFCSVVAGPKPKETIEFFRQFGCVLFALAVSKRFVRTLWILVQLRNWSWAPSFERGHQIQIHKVRPNKTP